MLRIKVLGFWIHSCCGMKLLVAWQKWLFTKWFTCAFRIKQKHTMVINVSYLIIEIDIIKYFKRVTLWMGGCNIAAIISLGSRRRHSCRTKGTIVLSLEPGCREWLMNISVKITKTFNLVIAHHVITLRLASWTEKERGRESKREGAEWFVQSCCYSTKSTGWYVWFTYN